MISVNLNFGKMNLGEEMFDIFRILKKLSKSPGCKKVIYLNFTPFHKNPKFNSSIKIQSELNLNLIHLF